MNSKNIVEFKINGTKGIFVKVPDGYNNFCIKQFSHSGTWLMQSDSRELNSWNTKIPTGEYTIVGFSDVLDEAQCASLGFSMDEYIDLLNKNDIVINYSKPTGKWLVLVNA